MRDSGDAPGAATPAGWAGIKGPALGRIAGAPVLGAEWLVHGRSVKFQGQLMSFVPVGAESLVDAQGDA